MGIGVHRKYTDVNNAPSGKYRVTFLGGNGGPKKEFKTNLKTVTNQILKKGNMNAIFTGSRLIPLPFTATIPTLI